MKKPFVISVAAVSGGGKTTVVNELKNRLASTAVISFDDYHHSKVYLARDINEWSADGNDCNEWHVQAIADDVEKLLTADIDYIILDFPFGRCNNCVGKYIDLDIYINTPLDIALARRTIRNYINRDTKRRPIEDILSAIGNELEFYLKTSRPTYARMSNVLIPKCDLVIDGTKPPEELAIEIIQAINNRK
jgi:uridine kinase